MFSYKNIDLIQYAIIVIQIPIILFFFKLLATPGATLIDAINAVWKFFARVLAISLSILVIVGLIFVLWKDHPYLFFSQEAKKDTTVLIVKLPIIRAKP